MVLAQISVNFAFELFQALFPVNWFLNLLKHIAFNPELCTLVLEGSMGNLVATRSGIKDNQDLVFVWHWKIPHLNINVNKSLTWPQYELFLNNSLDRLGKLNKMIGDAWARSKKVIDLSINHN
jgi:hypothetical protein